MSDGAKRRVLVTGAGGRIGGHLSNSLKERYDLRLHYFHTFPEHPPVDDWIRADIADFDQMAPAFEGIDAVVHMAGQPSTSASWEEVHEQNIVGTYNVLEAARRAGVREGSLRLDQPRDGHVRPRSAMASLCLACRFAPTRSTASQKRSAKISAATTPISLVSR